jgi:hypothetical protein
MAKKSGSRTPGVKGHGPGQAPPGGAPAKAAPAAAKATPGQAPGLLAATTPRALAGPAAAADDSSGADGPCFEFQQVIDEDGNPVLRKVQVPCPEK